MSDQEFLEKLKQLPADKKAEVKDFAEFLLQKAGNAAAKDVTGTKIRQAGFAKGAFIVHPGFDDPIEGMEEYTQ